MKQDKKRTSQGVKLSIVTLALTTTVGVLPNVTDAVAHQSFNKVAHAAETDANATDNTDKTDKTDNVENEGTANKEGTEIKTDVFNVILIGKNSVVNEDAKVKVLDKDDKEIKVNDDTNKESETDDKTPYVDTEKVTIDAGDSKGQEVEVFQVHNLEEGTYTVVVQGDDDFEQKVTLEVDKDGKTTIKDKENSFGFENMKFTKDDVREALVVNSASGVISKTVEKSDDKSDDKTDATNEEQPNPKGDAPDVDDKGNETTTSGGSANDPSSEENANGTTGDLSMTGGGDFGETEETSDDKEPSENTTDKSDDKTDVDTTESETTDKSDDETDTDKSDDKATTDKTEDKTDANKSDDADSTDKADKSDDKADADKSDDKADTDKSDNKTNEQDDNTTYFKSGHYVVGEDIDAGNYKVTNANNDPIKVTVSDKNGDKVDSFELKKDEEKELELKDGQKVDVEESGKGLGFTPVEKTDDDTTASDDADKADKSDDKKVGSETLIGDRNDDKDDAEKDESDNSILSSDGKDEDEVVDTKGGADEPTPEGKDVTDTDEDTSSNGVSSSDEPTPEGKDVTDADDDTSSTGNGASDDVDPSETRTTEGASTAPKNPDAYEDSDEASENPANDVNTDEPVTASEDADTETLPDTGASMNNGALAVGLGVMLIGVAGVFFASRKPKKD
ncbi:LPXTG cell wall anchor domain-containing protein [Staphylococcus hominis]|uniref:LPXTG cell wall anchor domain-containing protein n=1 Tax=Staphylococcus hominis TaxID=1290 RepID=UPI003DA1B983